VVVRETARGVRQEGTSPSSHRMHRLHDMGEPYLRFEHPIELSRRADSSMLETSHADGSRACIRDKEDLSKEWLHKSAESCASR
jgi:hypothetical protein